MSFAAWKRIQDTPWLVERIALCVSVEVNRAEVVGIPGGAPDEGPAEAIQSRKIADHGVRFRDGPTVDPVLGSTSELMSSSVAELTPEPGWKLFFAKSEPPITIAKYLQVSGIEARLQHGGYCIIPNRLTWSGRL